MSGLELLAAGGKATVWVVGASDASVAEFFEIEIRKCTYLTIVLISVESGSVHTSETVSIFVEGGKATVWVVGAPGGSVAEFAAGGTPPASGNTLNAYDGETGQVLYQVGTANSNLGLT